MSYSGYLCNKNWMWYISARVQTWSEGVKFSHLNDKPLPQVSQTIFFSRGQQRYFNKILIISTKRNGTLFGVFSVVYLRVMNLF